MRFIRKINKSGGLIRNSKGKKYEIIKITKINGICKDSTCIVGGVVEGRSDTEEWDGKLQPRIGLPHIGFAYRLQSMKLMITSFTNCGTAYRTALKNTNQGVKWRGSEQLLGLEIQEEIEPHHPKEAIQERLIKREARVYI